MSLNDQDRIARGRFAVMTGIRLVGIVMMLGGMLIWHTDLLREGGWPLVGIPLFAVGLVDSLLLPRVLAARWRTPKDL